MKKLFFGMILTLSPLFMLGCEDDNNDILILDTVPAAPQGVYSVTGDDEVFIYWNGPYEDDISGYVIYRSFDPITNYAEIGSVNAVNNPNLDLIYYEFIDDAVTNGVTYYYAVAAYDDAGQVSELSAEDVFDTPRPEGVVDLFDSTVSPAASAFAFAAQARVSYSNPAADVFVDRVGGVYYLNASDILTDIQDMGYTYDFADIGWAPTIGWSENGWLEIILGHTYVIWTRDGNFAKMRAEAASGNSILFRWAYQTDTGNPELIAPIPAGEKPVHNENYLTKKVASAAF